MIFVVEFYQIKEVPSILSFQRVFFLIMSGCLLSFLLSFFLSLFSVCVCVCVREREREREQGRVRERGTMRISSRLCVVSAEPHLGLELTNWETVT